MFLSVIVYKNYLLLAATLEFHELVTLEKVLLIMCTFLAFFHDFFIIINGRLELNVKLGLNVYDLGALDHLNLAGDENDLTSRFFMQHQFLLRKLPPIGKM